MFSPCSAKKTRPFLNLYRNEALSPIHQALPRCEVTHSDASRLPGSRSASLSSPATTKPSFRASSWDWFCKACCNLKVFDPRQSLVGGWALPLWKMMEWKSVGMMKKTQLNGKNTPNVPNHQTDQWTSQLFVIIKNGVFHYQLCLIFFVCLKNVVDPDGLFTLW